MPMFQRRQPEGQRFKLFRPKEPKGREDKRWRYGREWFEALHW